MVPGMGGASSHRVYKRGAVGITRARDYVFARFQEIEGLHVVLDPYTHPRCPTAATFNVVAWLPGKVNPQRLVVIGGHYDSRTVDNFDTKRPAPGANDSGSQTALVLEAARLLAEGEWDSTLVFIAFAGEEQGLFGSASIAASLSKYFPSAVVTAMLNSDIVGGDNTVNQEAELHQFRLYSPGTPRERRSIAPDGTPDDSSPSRGLMRYIATWATAYVPEMNIVVKLREDRPGRGSDHTSFIDNKFAAVRFMETAECSPSPVDNSCGAATLPCPPPPSIPASCKDFNTSHQHSPFDRVEFVTSEYTARITKLVASTAASLASAPSAPQTFTAVGTNAAVTVRWSAPKFGDVDHYVVAARPTMGNFYGRRFRVPPGPDLGEVGAARSRAESRRRVLDLGRRRRRARARIALRVLGGPLRRGRLRAGPRFDHRVPIVRDGASCAVGKRPSACGRPPIQRSTTWRTLLAPAPVHQIPVMRRVTQQEPWRGVLADHRPLLVPRSRGAFGLPDRGGTRALPGR